MRCAGVPEKFITGDASDHDKFMAWAKVLGKAIGNPLYHWSHLELRRFFDYDGILNESTAETVWELCNEKLRRPDFGVRDLIKRSNVELICTTDDPIDSLEWHEKLHADKTFTTTVLPAWRPDKAMNIEKATWPEYLEKLGQSAGLTIKSFADMKDALIKRMDFFAAHNCSLSDHALDYVMYAPSSDEEIEAIFAARMSGTIPTDEQKAKFKMAFMLFVAEQYHVRKWVMQLHYGCHRDNNLPMFERLGPDTGYDCVDNSAPSVQTAQFLGELERRGKLPKTILYSLNGNDNAATDTICGCFQSDEAVCTVQHGGLRTTLTE